MSYKLNKTDGTILTDLVDGTVDNTSSDLTLIGRNYSGFGEFLNENFIKLLENFSSSDEPANPIRGQLWYDTSENKLKIYNGEKHPHELQKPKIINFEKMNKKNIVR